MKSYPRCVTIISLLVLMVMVRSIYKISYVFVNYSLILPIIGKSSIQWTVISSLVWLALSIWIIVNIIAKSPLLPIRYKAITILFGLNYWYEQIFVFQNPLRKTNWLFLVGIGIFIIIWIFYVFSSDCIKIFFGELNE